MNKTALTITDPGNLLGIGKRMDAHRAMRGMVSS